MSHSQTLPPRGGLLRRLALVLGVIAAPIALAVTSQRLAATPEPPRLPQEVVTVQVVQTSAGAAPSSSTGSSSSGRDDSGRVDDAAGTAPAQDADRGQTRRPAPDADAPAVPAPTSSPAAPETPAPRVEPVDPDLGGQPERPRRVTPAAADHDDDVEDADDDRDLDEADDEQQEDD